MEVRSEDSIHGVDYSFCGLRLKVAKRVSNFTDVLLPHSGVVVYDALYKCLQEWDIEGKVSTITVNNTFYNDLVVRMLQNSLSFPTRFPLKG